MVDLKEFLEEMANEKYVGDFAVRNSDEWVELTNEDLVEYDTFVQSLGLFFWERGGKQFVEGLIKLRLRYPSTKNDSKNFEFFVQEANYQNEHRILEAMRIGYVQDARDFLDSLACLGKDKIKELIKEMK